MQESSAVGRIVDLVRDLRARCPWDAAQTPQTLRPYLVEEVFELDHALGEDDAHAIRVELGDLLLHLAFQVDDCGENIVRLSGEGLRLLDEAPRVGAHSTKVAFVHPKSLMGVLAELVEEPK